MVNQRGLGLYDTNSLGLYWPANVHAGAGSEVDRGDNGCRLHRLRWCKVVRANYDVIFSRTFVGGHLGLGIRPVYSGTCHTTH